MTKQHDSRGELRAAFTMRFIDRAKQDHSGGIHGLLLRAALITVLMYLLVIAFQLMGTAGVVFISIFFLLSTFAPALTRIARKKWLARQARKSGYELKPAQQSEG